MSGAVILLLLVVPPKPDKVDLVRGRVETKGDVWVGQRATVVVKLYSPTFFASAAAFDLPSVSGVVILPPQGRPLLGTEEVDGESYTTQTHELAVYPQRAGEIRLPPIGVRFTSDGGIGKPPIPREGKTNELAFRAKMPPGAEKLSTVLTTPKLILRETWKPEPGKAKRGAAFARTVTVQAANVPGMVLPPMRWEASEGIGVYPAPAMVTDSSERGEATGQRVELVTYVCEKPGTYRLPGVTLAWWDAESKQLRRERLPSRQIEVEAEPAPAESPVCEGPQPPTALTCATGVLVAAASLGLVGWLVRSSLRRWASEWAAARADSEAAWFSHFRAACHGGEPQQIEQALFAWLDRVPNEGKPWLLSDLAECSHDPELRAEIARLQNNLYGGAGARGAAAPLFRAVERSRAIVLLRNTESKRDEPLPALNPGCDGS